MEVTVDLTVVTEAATVVVFVALAVVAVVRAPRTGESGWWAAAAFASLAAALAAGSVPGWVGLELPDWAGTVELLLTLAFPYLLLRFTASFRDLHRAMEIGAAAVGLLAAATLLTSATGGGGDAPPVPLLVAVVYWAGVSAVTVVRLWRAGRGQPGVARRRMRLMATATTVLATAVVAVVLVPGQSWPRLATLLLVLAAALAFGIGFAPPRPLRLAWRRDEEVKLQDATTALLQAHTVGEVASHLLPGTVEILGAAGAVLTDDHRRVVASHGDAPPVGEPLDRAGADRAGFETADLGDGQGQLVVWTSAYTPFFGPEEIGLFRAMATVGAISLQRAALLADERARHDELEQARHDSEQARRDADRANLAKSEFLSRMSHELRTPMNAILGFSQLLETSDLSDDDRDAVGHILKAGRHLLALINDVLDLSRIEAGTLTISREPVHAGELITDSLALVRPLAISRDIRISGPDDDCDQYVLTDRQRCRQVLINLLSNAIKYNHDDGSVTVGCDTSRSGRMLRVTVTDTGPGIDPERQDRLFEPFERLGAEASAVEGTGLGLALTKQLVERLDGHIGVTSRPGAGSTFWVDLPVTAPPAGTTAEEPASAPVATGDYRLLLVEDNLANLKVVEAMLRLRPGITVLPAMQGTVALDLARDHRPDIIILDLHLPDLPGRDVLARLKADPRTGDIPVIIASADATPSRIRQLRDEGAADYITKPLDLEAFLGAIDTALAPTD